MLQTLFPMATGTHGLNNGLLVEEQEERSWTAGLGDFQQDRTRLKTCASVFLCVSRHKRWRKRSPAHPFTHTDVQWHKQVQICVCLSATIVIVFSCLHTSIIYFQMKLGQKRGRKCCTVICICIRINTWLITIYYVFSGQAHSWAEKVLTCTWGA